MAFAALVRRELERLCSGLDSISFVLGCVYGAVASFQMDVGVFLLISKRYLQIWEVRSSIGLCAIPPVFRVCQVRDFDLILCVFHLLKVGL